MSEVEKMDKEISAGAAQARTEAAAKMARLAERDAAYAAAYPKCATGAVRGRVSAWRNGSSVRAVDVETHKEIDVSVSVKNWRRRSR